MSPIAIRSSRNNTGLETGKSKLWLFLVGVNEYQDRRLPCLRYCASDCKLLGDALAEATQLFPHKETFIHHDFVVEKPSYSTVYKSLNQIIQSAQPEDTILFYFSGHGMLEHNTLQTFLCLGDTQVDDLPNTGLALQSLLNLLGNCAARQQLVWLDACHSGEMTFTKAKGETTAQMTNPANQMLDLLRQRAKKSKGFYALLSCDSDQQSWEFPELGHGVFTYYLVRGLRGEAADMGGVIEADALYRYVYQQTRLYIEQTNQQLRLINQQKRSRGEKNLHSEYPLQTPKRIVEGVGELILGFKSDAVELYCPRKALVVEGITTSKTALSFSKVLRSFAGFEIDYFPRSGQTNLKDLQQAIQSCLQSTGNNLNLELGATVLLYLRVRICLSESGDAVLVLGDNIHLSRSWLRQQLRRSAYEQQIIILDCPDVASVQDWVEDLQLGSERGQCIIAAASPKEFPSQFSQALENTLKTAPQSGLSAAGWIAQLQTQYVQQQLHTWLSGAKGVIEVVPSSTLSRNLRQSTAIDLGFCPYRGLRAFGEEDSQYFFGRETLTEYLVSQITDKPFLAVVGASGSGKSSIVQAGLIAQLRLGKQLPGSELWWIGSFRPGDRPLSALALRLAGGEISHPNPHLLLEGMLYQGVEGFVCWLRQRPEPMLVLAIDQFEELFTLADAVERERFLQIIFSALESAPDKLKLIITLRADFIAACLEVPALAKFLMQYSVLIPPSLTESEYRRAIVNPAEQVGLTVEPELVEVLLQELNHSPGDLPLLEFVLEQLWENRKAGELTLQAYQQHLGGIKGALERKAQAVYESLDPLAKECARWIFLSLTQLGEGTEDTRRRLLKSELIVKKYPTDLVDRTLQALTTAKLVVVNLEEEVSANSKNPSFPHSPLPIPHSPITVEVAHEVLIRHWSTLRWWLEENRALLRSQRQIEQAAQLWKQNGEQADFLLQGVRLAEAEDIYINYTDQLSYDVQRFIEACLALKQRQQQKEKNRLKQAQRAVTAIAVLGFAAFGFGVLAYQQSQTARLREIQALNSLAANYLLSHKQLDALLTSVKAGQELRNMAWFVMSSGQAKNLQTTTVTTLSQAVYETQENNRLLGHNSWVTSVSFSPDGQTIASASWDQTIKLWKSNGTLLHTLEGHEDGVTSVAFSPDGSTIVSASADATIKLWSREGKLLKTLNGHTRSVNSVSFSPDGQTIVSASDDRTIKLWSRDGKLLKTFTGHTQGVNGVSFSPDGQTIASASDDRTLKLWKLDGTLITTLQGHTSEVNSVTFSPDGNAIASNGADRTIRIWSRDGRLLTTLQHHNGNVRSVKFSPDGKIILSASADNTIKIWKNDGTLLETIYGHTGEVNSISFSPDGKTIVSASDDTTVRLWNLYFLMPKTFYGHQDSVSGVSFNSQGDKIISFSTDRTAKLWSLDGKLLKTFPSPIPDIISAALTSDQKIVALARSDRTIQLYTESGTLLHTLKGHNNVVLNMSFSPDNQILASASNDKTIKLWSIDGRLLHTLSGHQSWVTNVKFSSDGKKIASASGDKTIKIWNLDGRLLRTLKDDAEEFWGIDFSPDGKKLVSGTQNGKIKIWSLDGRLLQSISGHNDMVNSVSFSPNGKMIASASDDSTIKLWSIDGILLKTLQGHTDHVRGVSFSPDGKNLASASVDKTVKLWNLQSLKLQTSDLDNLVKSGCDRLHDYLKTNRNFSAEERQLCSN